MNKRDKLIELQNRIIKEESGIYEIAKGIDINETELSKLKKIIDYKFKQKTGAERQLYYNILTGITIDNFKKAMATIEKFYSKKSNVFLTERTNKDIKVNKPLIPEFIKERLKGCVFQEFRKEKKVIIHLRNEKEYKEKKDVLSTTIAMLKTIGIDAECIYHCEFNLIKSMDKDDKEFLKEILSKI